MIFLFLFLFHVQFTLLRNTIFKIKLHDQIFFMFYLSYLGLAKSLPGLHPFKFYLFFLLIIIIINNICICFFCLILSDNLILNDLVLILRYPSFVCLNNLHMISNITSQSVIHIQSFIIGSFVHKKWFQSTCRLRTQTFKKVLEKFLILQLRVMASNSSSVTT